MAGGVYQQQLTVPVLSLPRAQNVDVSSGIEAVAQAQRQREARHLNEMRLEAATQLESLQAEAEAVPFDQRKAFFDQGAQKLRGDFDKKFGFLDMDLRGGFHDEWGRMFALKGIEVNASAKKGEADHNYATMEGVIAKMEGQAARASSPKERAFFVEQIGATLHDALATGAIDETKAGDVGRESLRRIDKNVLSAMIEDPNRGPNEALRALHANEFGNLKEEDRLAMIERAERKIQHTVAMSDHADIVNERNRKRMGETIAKEGFDLLAAGKMTEDWITKNRPILDTSDFRMLRQGMQEGGGAESSDALASIYRKVYVDNADVSGEVLSAMTNRQINASTAKSLLDENKNNTPARQAKTYLTTYLKPSDVNDSPAASQSYAEAVAEFDRRFAQDPNQDAMDLARKVIGRNSVVQFDKMTLVMPLPDYAVGGRKDFDEKKTQAATVAAFLARHNNDRAAAVADPAFKVEARKIAAWAEAARKLRAAQDAAKGATK